MTLNQSYSYQCLIENLLDPAHLQFTHEGTQGKYIGPIDKMVPDSCVIEVNTWKDDPKLPWGVITGLVQTNMTAKPQNYRIIFEPPVTVRLEVVFPNGWRF